MKKLHSDTGCNFSLEEALIKLEAYCAYQDRCVQEVREKCRTWAISADNTETLIKKLTQSRFLDDERFAFSYVSGKFRMKQWGRIKIRMNLRMKKIPDATIVKAMAAIDGDEYINVLKELAVRKLKDLMSESDPWKKKAKLYRFLAAKGYEQDLVSDVVTELIS